MIGVVLLTKEHTYAANELVSDSWLVAYLKLKQYLRCLLQQRNENTAFKCYRVSVFRFRYITRIMGFCTLLFLTGSIRYKIARNRLSFNT
jgi:hypothetical protein